MKKKAFWAVLTAATIAGFTGLFIKNMTISPASQAWLRMGVPAIVMGIWMRLSEIPFFQGNWKTMITASVLNTVRMLFFFAAYVYTSIGNAVIMFYTFPIFAAILGSLVLKEKISQRQKILLGVAFLGILFAFSHKEFSFEDTDFLGMVSAVLSALIYSYTVILFKSESHNYTPQEMLFYQNISGLVLLFPFFEFGNANLNDYALGMSYGVLIGIIGFGFFFYGLKQLKASTAAALMYMEVVSALIISYIVMGELLSFSMIIGGVMIIGSSFLLGQNK